jgi:hypothetical protein
MPSERRPMVAEHQCSDEDELAVDRMPAQMQGRGREPRRRPGSRGELAVDRISLISACSGHWPRTTGQPLFPISRPRRDPGGLGEASAGAHRERRGRGRSRGLGRRQAQAAGGDGGVGELMEGEKERNQLDGGAFCINGRTCKYPLCHISLTIGSTCKKSC